MNINELESFKLSDAVKFHDTLNPALFTDEHLQSDVRAKLLKIAEEFIDYLGINSLDIDDITISGSNAAYTYTDHSDIDLHILVDMNKINNDKVYRELFNAKKNLFNDNHNIKIRGYDVELYIQDKNESVKSLGEYSVLNDDWIKFPVKRKSTIDINSVKQKVTKLVQLTELAMRTNNIDRINGVLDTIKRYRKSGLDKHGEFGPENIAFKILRTNGIITKLYDRKDELLSKQLSLDEQSKKTILDKPTLTVDELAKKHNVTRKHIIDQLVKGIDVELEHTSDKSVAREIAKDHLGEDPDYYTKLATVELENVEEAFDQPYKSKWEKSEHGDYDVLTKLPDGTNLSIMFNNEGDDEWQVEFYRNNSQEVTGEGDAQRIFATILNAIQKFIKKYQPWRLKFSASKSVEPGQNSQSRAKLYDRLVQRYAENWGYDMYHEDHGDQVTYELTRLKNDIAEASGYIPSQSEKNDPRFKTALTVDVHPNTMKKNASKFGWKIARDGRPPLLRK